MWDSELLGGGLHSLSAFLVFHFMLIFSSSDIGSFTPHLCFSDRGFEEKSQRGAGQGGGEGQKAQQWGNRCTDAAGPAKVGICVVYLCE